MKIGLASAAGALTAVLAAWRRSRKRSANARHLQRFQDFIVTLNDEQLLDMHGDYSTLSAFDANPQLREKRDACAAELNRRVRRRLPRNIGAAAPVDTASVHRWGQ